MTPRQIELVQHTFRSITPIAEQTTALFYARLFELEPSLRPRFQGDLRTHGRNLMQTLAFIVSALDHDGTLRALLRQLAGRCWSCGLTDHHINVVGQALLWTLRHGLGVRFDLEVQAAWAAMYLRIVNELREAAPASTAA